MIPDEIVDEYFCKVCDIPASELDPASHALVEVWHSFGLIQGGGLHNYLCEVGNEVQTTLAHYRAVNLHKCHELLDEAYKLWREYWPHVSPDKSDPDAFLDRFGHKLDVIEWSFCDEEEEIVNRLYDVVQSQTKMES